MSTQSDSSTNSSPHIGFVLRDAREQAELSLADVSKSLRIQSGYLNAIENLHVDALPSLGYVLGFIRSYAGYLGMDAVDAVAQYKIDIECPENLGMRDRPHFVPKRKIRFPRGSFAAGAVFSCMAVIVTWYGWNSDAQSAQLTQPVLAQTQNFDLKPIEPKQGDPDSVSLKAVGPSWVQVKNDDGEVLISKIMVPGEIYETTKDIIPNITLRDAGAIELYIAGERVGPLGEQGQTLENYVLAETEQ